MIDSKAQILKTIPANSCCSHAFINVLLYSCGSIDSKQSNIFISADLDVLEKTKKILFNFYPDIDIMAWEHFLLLKGNIYNLLVDSNIEQNGDCHLEYFSSECDRLTILKSFYILNGNFYFNQDNNKNSTGYSLEIIIKDETIADIVKKIFDDFGFELKKIKRKQYFVLYTKNSTIICDIFVKLGAVSTALDIQNNLAIREMRNNVNRQNNCFESNLDKTINASSEQLKAISYIIDNYSLDYLDESLKAVALARLANPEVSLSALATLLDNSLSRAGIKYRLDKIINIYKKLKGDKE